MIKLKEKMLTIAEAMELSRQQGGVNISLGDGITLSCYPSKEAVQQSASDEQLSVEKKVINSNVISKQPDTTPTPNKEVKQG